MKQSGYNQIVNHDMAVLGLGLYNSVVNLEIDDVDLVRWVRGRCKTMQQHIEQLKKELE